MSKHEIANLQPNAVSIVRLVNTEPVTQTIFLYCYDRVENVFLPLTINTAAGPLAESRWSYNPFQQFRIYPLTLAAKEETVFSCRLPKHSSSQKLCWVSTPYHIPSYQPTLQNEIEGNYVELVICGMMFMMWVYITLKYTQLRTPEYLFYSLYILFSFLHFLAVLLAKVSVDWYDNPMEREFYHRFFQTLSHAAYFQFFRHFTRTYVDQPVFDKVLKGATYAAFAYILFDVVMVFVVADQQVPLETIWIYIRLVFVVFVAVSLIFWVSRSKNPLRTYLIIGNAFLITGGLLTMLFNPYRHWIAHWMVPFAFPLFYYRAGVLLEVICFSLGLGFKQKLDEKKRVEAESNLQREHLELSKIKEVDAAKSSFFANISHEFRTPLTLIQAPADKILAETGNRFQREIDLIKRNSQALLKLINQVLELSKLESGIWTSNLRPTERNKFFKRASESFEFVAQQKAQHWTLQLPDEERLMMMDEDVVEKIINNLVSNAIKYSPAGSEVSLRVLDHTDQLEFVVTDTGNGIPPERLPFIFDRYYRATDGDEEGIGIGLAHTKELVKCHNGTIDVTSEMGRGTQFTVCLSVQSLSTEVAESPKEIQPESYFSEGAVRTAKSLLLLVEDNDELRSFLTSELSRHYQVLATDRSSEAWLIAQREVPDVVLSDWMMPGMTGIELCEKLKKSEVTNHIPVVLLTARASDSARLQGWQTGADDYIVKPFQLDELTVRLKNLIDQRNTLKSKYSVVKKSSYQPVVAVSIDDKFIERVRSAVEHHLPDAQFSVETLAEEVGLSKVQLYRKLMALTGSATAEFIRNYRLDRAADLLRQSAGNVSEVAFQTGFESQSHFARVYRERFGYPPSQTPKDPDRS